MAKPLHSKYLIIGFSIALIVYIAALILTPRPIDWSLSFSKKDKIPYGSSILFAELGQLFPEGEIKTMHSPIYNYSQQTNLNGTSFIFINDYFEPDDLDLNMMLDVVKSGSNVFVAAVEFTDKLQDTLRFAVGEDVFFKPVGSDSTILNLVNPKLKSSKGYTYKKAFHKAYFQCYDTLKTTVLGFDNDTLTNFVRIEYGAGNFFINTNPLAFTNYNLLIDKNYEYAFKCLSYLPNAAVIWDEHYKQKDAVSGSEFRYILSQNALRYAWYLLLFALLTYMVFGGKRRQRMIPIVKPPRNTSLSFVETIGRLYFRKNDHLNIAKKKYTYFLEFLRTKHYIDTNHIGYEMYKEVSQKFEVPGFTVKQLFNMAQRIHQSKSISEEDLIQFDKKIEFFYDRSRGKKGCNNKLRPESYIHIKSLP